MASVAQSILAHNAGRDPERLRMKFKALRADAFSFMRGTCALFYQTLPADKLFRDAPAVPICGDLHLENFGTYKGDNRLVYFDINDFDEAALAPFTLDLVRFVASVRLAAKHLKYSSSQAVVLCRGFLDTYSEMIVDGKPRWVERSTATGRVRALLKGIKSRSRKEFLDDRAPLSGKKRQLKIDGRKALPASARQAQHVTHMLKIFAAGRDEKKFYRVLDIARRIAGTGSLGLERYAVLVEGRGSPNGNFLLDLKIAPASSIAWLANQRQPKQPAWKSQAERIVTMQRLIQSIPTAHIAALDNGDKSYVLKELQPSFDRLNLQSWRGGPGIRPAPGLPPAGAGSEGLETLQDIIHHIAQVGAWGHLRGCGRLGAASVEELGKFVGGAAWQAPLLKLAEKCTLRVLVQWKSYCDAYDAGELDYRTGDTVT